MPAAKNPVASRKTTTATADLFRKSAESEVMEEIPEAKPVRVKKTYYITSASESLLLQLQRQAVDSGLKKPEFSDLVDAAIKLLAHDRLSANSDAA